MRASEPNAVSAGDSRFITAFDKAPIGIALVNDRHEIIMANQALCDILGYQPSELPDINFRDITHPDDQKTSIASHEKLFSGLIQSYQLSKRYIRRNGQYVWCRVSVSRAYDEQSKAYYAIAHIEDAYQDKLLSIERRVLARISAHEPLGIILESTAIMVEEVIPDIRCSILLLDEDGEHLRHGAAPSLPDEYNQSVDGIRIGPDVGTCGTAAYLRKPVITTDIGTDPRWTRYRELALKHSLHACWSMPVIATDGSVLGTFAVYYDEARQPPSRHKHLIQQIASLVEIAISRHREREALERSEERYRVLYDENPVMYVTLDRESKILSLNRHATEVLGYSADQLIDSTGLNLVHHEDIEVARQSLQDCLSYPGEVQNCMVRIIKADKSYIWTQLFGRAIRDVASEISILVVGEDVTEMQRLSKKLSYHASHDDLTGLLNRREFEIRLNHALSVARKDHVVHAVCFLDLDQFKIVNDSCGHVAGDELLRQIGALLRKHLRKSDILARLGGDEFGVLMEYCDPDKAQSTAQKILEDIREYKFLWDNKTFSIGVSIGIAPVTAESGTVVDVMKTVDNACYIAKESGRDQIHVYRDDDRDYQQRNSQLHWITRINSALEQDRLVLYTQAIVPVANDDQPSVYYEILVRMIGEDGNIIAPGIFLPTAERFNLASKIDRWVIDHALAFLSDNTELQNAISMLFINLSGQSLGIPDFQRYAQSALLDSGIVPEKICFEITETAAITNLTSATDFMSAMKRLGCLFALDDFGSGLSSFAYLKQLPVDFIKIDGIFIQDMMNDPINLAMVWSIHDIGRIMGKQTIAECVENDEILEQLRVIGVDYAQGYGIGRPFPLESLKNNLPGRNGG